MSTTSNVTVVIAAVMALTTLASPVAGAQASSAAPPGQSSAPAASSSASPHIHAPVHRPAPAHAASGATAATAANADDRPVLPRLIAIATPEPDDAIPRFALYAARDIETMGLQFPMQAEGIAPDGDVVITLSLREGATTRMRDFSRQHMNEPMTLIVDGVEMLTATIRSELGGKFQLQMPKEKARLLFQRVLAKAGPAT
ncbi:hypothetical protein PIN31115_03413 [Pandoraea iniqua]|uniref:Preprotein translocase subunit SecD n=1 Tax=Pandoraea iniqua TaxID=2508288 RepID=A0A5E4WU89_9BURK|nr:hypothetical protein [Pandoraea iniqua]VVE26466.1 hypothetical protein PIN31115_03413 [Pandoraea iniqua]